jgi:hypothetical protein
MAIIKISNHLLQQVTKIEDKNALIKQFESQETGPAMLQKLQRSLLLPARITRITFQPRMEIAEVKTTLDGFTDLEVALPRYARTAAGVLKLKEVSHVR